MKFVHIADMHFDSAFVNLSDKDILGDLRRLEQRKVFKKVIEYIKENSIPYLLISGDLYEHKYVKQSTIEYINNLFKEIPETKIFISPGNHDPFVKNSYYNKYEWSKNVKIFSSKIEIVEGDNVDIYGYGFDDFYCTNSDIENIQIKNKEKINILITHGTLDVVAIDDREYNTLKRKNLEKLGFDYIALGHIHKLDYSTNIVYPGSMISLGFDELGEHGMIVGNIEKNNLDLEFIQLDEETFREINLDITDIYSKEELIEKINELEIKDNEYIKIILTGNRNFEINKYEILKYLTNDRIIKIKDKTKIAYDLEKKSNNNTLKGLFARNMQKKLNQNNTLEEQEIIEKAIEIGLEALE